MREAGCFPPYCAVGPACYLEVGKRGRADWRNRQICGTVPQILYLALRTTPLFPTSPQSQIQHLRPLCPPQSRTRIRSSPANHSQSASASDNAPRPIRLRCSHRPFGMRLTVASRGLLCGFSAVWFSLHQVDLIADLPSQPDDRFADGCVQIETCFARTLAKTIDLGLN